MQVRSDRHRYIWSTPRSRLCRWRMRRYHMRRWRCGQFGDCSFFIFLFLRSGFHVDGKWSASSLLLRQFWCFSISIAKPPEPPNPPSVLIGEIHSEDTTQNEHWTTRLRPRKPPAPSLVNGSNRRAETSSKTLKPTRRYRKNL